MRRLSFCGFILGSRAPSRSPGPRANAAAGAVRECRAQPARVGLSGTWLRENAFRANLSSRFASIWKEQKSLP